VTDSTSLLNRTLANLPGFVRPLLNTADAYSELEATSETIEPQRRPRLYQLETTTRCNLACPFCPRTVDLVKNGQRDLTRVMPLDAFTKILDDMPWLQSLELFHFGEPFMHNIAPYIAECASRGIYTVLASNLLPATRAKLDAAFDAGLDFLVMDVDSLDAARYAKMRVNGRLEMLKPIVNYILTRPKRPYCVAQTIMVDGTPEYTEAEFVAWAGAAADEVRYKFLDSFRGSIADGGTLGPDDVCREPFYGFTVHVNGDVVPCDRDWAGEAVMGNVLEESVMAIWTGERFTEFRRQMKSRDKPALCRNCPEGRLVNLRSQPHVQVNMFKGARVEHDK